MIRIAVWARRVLSPFTRGQKTREGGGGGQVLLVRLLWWHGADPDASCRPNARRRSSLGLLAS